MKLDYLIEEDLQAFIKDALKEDIGSGDHSSNASIPVDAKEKARLIVKQGGVLAGVAMAKRIFENIDPELKINLMKDDGDEVKVNDIAFTVEGNARNILTSERLVLNCMQRMSGIATYTHNLQSMIAHTHTKVLDTRKTTPNFRIAEKWAVAIGGGMNHRFGLFDMIILKDNHVDYAGGVQQAVNSTLNYLKENNLDIKIELEVRSLEEVKEAIAVGQIDRIMLDNMGIEETKKAVALINGQFKTEASGGITEKNIVAIAETGVDFISIGALTHSYKSLDMSLKAF